MKFLYEGKNEKTGDKKKDGGGKRKIPIIFTFHKLFEILKYFFEWL
jgi:hypothetical protein